MNTKGYIVEQLGKDIEAMLGGAVTGRPKFMSDEVPMEPPPDFLAALDPDAREAILALCARLRSRTFPDLRDVTPEFGEDLTPFPNIDRDAFALANDGAGNYWLLCRDGAVRSWCHDEGGVMEDHNSFSTLDEALACWVRFTAVRRKHVKLADVRAVFEQKQGDNDNGWGFYFDQLLESE